MLYFTIKSDITFLKYFKQNVESLWRLEKDVRRSFKPSVCLSGNEYHEAVLDKATSCDEGKSVRVYLAKNIHRAVAIAQKLGVSIDVQSIPAPAVGGIIIPVNLFDAVLKDTSYGGVDSGWIRDKINETIGKAESRLRYEFINLFNPFYWLYSLLVFIVRIPFHLVSISGFDVSKVEDHFLSKLFKLAEIALIVYMLLKLGMEKTGVLNLIKEIIR